MPSEATPFEGLKALALALAFSSIAIAPPLAWALRQGVFDPPLPRLARALTGNDAAALRAARRIAAGADSPNAAFALWLADNAAHTRAPHTTPLRLETGNTSLTLYVSQRSASHWNGTEMTDATGTRLTLRAPDNSTPKAHPPPFSAFLPLSDLF